MLVAPGVLEVPPPGMSAIFSSISAVARLRPDGTILLRTGKRNYSILRTPD